MEEKKKEKRKKEKKTINNKQQENDKTYQLDLDLVNLLMVLLLWYHSQNQLNVTMHIVIENVVNIHPPVWLRVFCKKRTEKKRKDKKKKKSTEKK